MLTILGSPSSLGEGSHRAVLVLRGAQGDAKAGISLDYPDGDECAEVKAHRTRPTTRPALSVTVTERDGAAQLDRRSVKDQTRAGDAETTRADRLANAVNL